jgi:soluble lytic murein transglycosylase-like protein
MGAARSTGALLRSLAWAAVLALAPVAVHAEVLEIGDDGTVTVHSGPEIVTSSHPSAQTIAPAMLRSRHHTLHAVANPSVRDAIASASANYAVSPTLVAAVAKQESGFNPDAVSKKGARGVMQLMPSTQSTWCPGACSPEANVAAGTAYLKNLLSRYHGDIALALAAYNAGPGAVDRFGGVPPYRETTAYVDSVFANLAASALNSAQ